MKSIWTWLDGNKTAIGGLVLALSTLVPQIMADFNIPMNEGTVGGLIIVGIGIAHKICKTLGWSKPATQK